MLILPVLLCPSHSTKGAKPLFKSSFSSDSGEEVASPLARRDLCAFSLRHPRRCAARSVPMPRSGWRQRGGCPDRPGGAAQSPALPCTAEHGRSLRSYSGVWGRAVPRLSPPARPAPRSSPGWLSRAGPGRAVRGRAGPGGAAPGAARGAAAGPGRAGPRMPAGLRRGTAAICWAPPARGPEPCPASCCSPRHPRDALTAVLPSL